MNEDELLKNLFKKVKMEEPSGNFTFKVMEQILANPDIKPAADFCLYGWWLGVGLLSVASMYLTGVFVYLYQVFIPYFIGIYGMFSEIFLGMAELVPAGAGIIPASFIIQLILPAIILILLIDNLIGYSYRKL
jgi:hypothetical protein